MSQARILKILRDHSIECFADGEHVCALAQCCRGGLATFGEWARFDSITTAGELYAWLGY